MRPSILPSAVTTSLGLYVATAAAIFLSILHRTGGVFVYALDDPYIHLALAEQLARGHYGINYSEASSPSSSLLWPVLLAPLSGHAVQVYLPLILNVLFGLVAAALIGIFVETLPSSHSVTSFENWAQKTTLAVLLVFAANLPSLTFLGLEHVLQILLSISCAYGMIHAMQGKPIPKWCLAAAILGPSVRYENLALTVAIVIALLGLRQIGKAISVFVLTFVPLLAFSLYLHSLGLPFLPTSVLMKGNIDPSPLAAHESTLRLIASNLWLDFHSLGRVGFILMLLVTIFLLRSARDRMIRVVLLAVTTVVLGQLLIGKFGWFYRYQVYAVIFASIILLRVAAESCKIRFLPIAAVLLLFAAPFIRATQETPLASMQIYQQQFQMQRFEDEFFRQNIALNDIGLVSYGRPPGVDVLDLYGLASPEVFRERDRSSPWLQKLVDRHHVRLAIIYPHWYNIPSTWSLIATMCRSDWTQTTGMRCVSFYSTSGNFTVADRADVASFSVTLPKSVKMTFF